MMHPRAVPIPGLKLIEGPSDTPVTLDQAKKHLRVDFTDDDDTIQLLLEAATQATENFVGRALMTQTWELTLDQFPGFEQFLYMRRPGYWHIGHRIGIPLPPLQSILSVKYDDSAGVEQTLDPSLYEINNAMEPGCIAPVSGGSWPQTRFGLAAVRIRFVAGYAVTDSPGVDVPGPLKSIVLLTLGTLYNNRENVIVGATRAVAIELPWAAQALAGPYIVHLGIG